MWRTSYLHTGGHFHQKHAELLQKFRSGCEKADSQAWNILYANGRTPGVVNWRTIECHEYGAGGRLNEEKHYDSGSLITMDIMLADPTEDFQGGVINFPEHEPGVGGGARMGQVKKGDAVFFLSHKYHNVEPVTGGTRRVLVAELWEGGEKQCQHRCHDRSAPDMFALSRKRPRSEVKDTAKEMLSKPHHQDVISYYRTAQAEGCLNSKLEIRDTDDRGNGIFVKNGEVLSSGEEILREKPFLGAQYTSSKAQTLSCGTCFRYLESVEEQFKHRWKSEEAESSEPWPENARLPLQDGYPLPSSVPCREASGLRFCSSECEAKAWDTWQCLLCPGEKSAVDRGKEGTEHLNEFLRLAEEHNDLIMVAAQAVASVCTSADARLKATGGFEVSSDKNRNDALLAAWEPYRLCSKKPWWEVATASGTDNAASEDAFRNRVKALAEASLDLLAVALKPEAMRYPALFTLEVWGDILGMLDLSTVAMRVWNPCNEWLEEIGEVVGQEAEGFEEVMAQAAPILEVLGGAADGEAHCTGAAFYPISNVVNHSCLPNAAALSESEGAGEKDGSAVIVSLREIQSNEEVTIEYLEVQGEDFETRRSKVRDQYHFICTCTTCKEEAMAKGVPLRVIK